MVKVFPHTLVSALIEASGGAPPPPPPGYAPPSPAAAPGPGTSSSGKAVAALVLGIVGICLIWIPFVGLIGFVTGVLAIILGGLGKKEVDQSGGRITGGGMAIAGLVLGIIQVVLLLLVVLFFSAALSDLTNELETASEMALLWF